MNVGNKPLDYKKLGETIRDVFIDSDKYTFDKHVPVLEVDGKYVGDLFDMTIFQPQGERPPIFYHTFSPFDVVSGKSSQYAAVFESAELILSGEISPYVHQRTAVMSPLVLSAIGVTKLAGKQILFVGTGNVARCALAAFKEFYPGITQADFHNSGSEATEFISLATKLGVGVKRGNLEALKKYDVIVCHSGAKEPVLTTEMMSQIKPGAFIAAFASEDKTEVAKEYYDSERANILIDWDQTAAEAVELHAAVEKGLAQKEVLLCLHDIFTGTKIPDVTKRYTIYRSHGTPMQNLAFLKLLTART
jgi:hypothetical protein